MKFDAYTKIKKVIQDFTLIITPCKKNFEYDINGVSKSEFFENFYRISHDFLCEVDSYIIRQVDNSKRFSAVQYIILDFQSLVQNFEEKFTNIQSNPEQIIMIENEEIYGKSKEDIDNARWFAKQMYLTFSFYLNETLYNLKRIELKIKELPKYNAVNPHAFEWLGHKTDLVGLMVTLVLKGYIKHDLVGELDMFKEGVNANFKGVDKEKLHDYLQRVNFEKNKFPKLKAALNIFDVIPTNRNKKK